MSVDMKMLSGLRSASRLRSRVWPSTFLVALLESLPPLMREEAMLLSLWNAS